MNKAAKSFIILLLVAFHISYTTIQVILGNTPFHVKITAIVGVALFLADQLTR